MRKRIYEIIGKPHNGSLGSKIYYVFMLVVVLVSLVPLMFKQDTWYFEAINKVAFVVFSVDYILRWLTADYKYNDSSAKSFLKYPFGFMAIVDLLSILPYIGVLQRGFKVLKLVKAAKVVRIVRALEVIRIVKLARYSSSITIISKVLKQSKAPLLAVGTMAVVYIFVSALIIFNVEPQLFENFFEAFYWATLSLTTVGYGDLYPTSVLGRIVTMCSSIIGIAVVALPAGIITAGYMKAMREKKDTEEENQPS